jgi:Ca-activated chloride channel family protein
LAFGGFNPDFIGIPIAQNPFKIRHLMYRFENPEMLWGLAIVPLLWVVFIWLRFWRRRSRRKFADAGLMPWVAPEVPRHKHFIKTSLFSFAAIFMVVALANPQIGSKLEEVKRSGFDVMIALDLSNSMLAEDLTPNRLEAAKRALSKLVEKFKNDRIGIVVFGGEAYVQLPLTSDYAAAKLFLTTLNTDVIPVQGTAIGKAVDLCMTGFDPKSKAGRAIVIITDGENHEDDALGAINKAVSEGVIVHAIGMGAPEGSPIPLYNGKQKLGFRKDRDGNSIVSRLNEEMLRSLAEAGGGIYVRATRGNAGLDLVMEELNRMQKEEYGSKVYTDYEDRFQYPLGIALFLLVLEFFISERKNQWFEKLRLFEDKTL